MKKIILSILMITSLAIITGCSVSEKTKYRNNIRKFIKDNMISEWSYNDDKIKINDDKSVQLNYYHVADWTSCAASSKTAVLQLVASKDAMIDEIPSIIFVCSNTDGADIAKAIYSNLNEINSSTLQDNAKYYDAKGNLMTGNIESEYKKNCGEYHYNDLVKKGNSDLGNKVKISGKVIQINENAVDDYLILAASNVVNKKVNDSDKIVVFVRKTLVEEAINKGDKFNFYGELLSPDKGNVAYGVNADSPSLNAYYFDKIR